MVKRNSDAAMIMKNMKVKHEKFDESSESFMTPKKEKKDSTTGYGSTHQFFMYKLLFSPKDLI